MTDENTDENRTDQRTALLVVFGMVFMTIGLGFDVPGPYAVLSFILLGLGVVLPFIAGVLEIGEDDAVGETE